VHEGDKESIDLKGGGSTRSGDGEKQYTIIVLMRGLFYKT
jgi:hypothetical protein